MGRRRSDIEEDGYVWHKYGAKNVRGRKVGYFNARIAVAKRVKGVEAGER